MNFKGIFKGILPDAAQAAGVALSGVVLNKIPVANDQPLIKAGVVYLGLKLIGSKVKGIPGSLIEGIKIGALANAVGAGLAKAGVQGIEEAFVAGATEYVDLRTPTDRQDNSYIEGTDPFAPTF